MASISSLVILFLTSYVSAVYADNSDADNLTKFLGPNNVAQIPSDVWAKIVGGIDKSDQDSPNSLSFLSQSDISSIPKGVLEKIFSWYRHNHHHHHSRKTTTKRPTTTCTNCAPSLNVTPGSAPINQTQGVDPTTGCSTITFSCSNPGSGQVAFQYFYQDQDLGTTIQNGTSGTTIPNQITRMAVCNKAGQYWFVENSVMHFIDTVNCIVA